GDAIEAGEADPGAIRQSDHIVALRQMVDALADIIYVRDEASIATNGWKAINGFNPDLQPGETQPPDAAVEITFANATERAELLSEMTASGVVVRVSGQWSNDVGSDMPPQGRHLDEIDGFIDTILANGAWTRAGSVEADISSGQHVHAWADYEFGSLIISASDWQEVDELVPNAIDELGNPNQDSVIDDGFGVSSSYWIWLSPQLHYSDGTADLEMSYGLDAVFGPVFSTLSPASDNSLGGNAMIEPALGWNAGELEPAFGQNLALPSEPDLDDWRNFIDGLKAQFSTEQLSTDPATDPSLRIHIYTDGTETDTFTWSEWTAVKDLPQYAPGNIDGRYWTTSKSFEGHYVVDDRHWIDWDGNKYVEGNLIDEDGTIGPMGMAEIWLNAPIDLPEFSSSFFGRVENSALFSYSPESFPSDEEERPSLGSELTSQLRQSTEMQIRNSATDMTADGIVDVPFGAGLGGMTGSQVVTVDAENPLTFIPVATDLTGQLPLHAYFVQGAFQSNDFDDLRSHDFNYSEADERGLVMAYSGNTHVENTLLINDDLNHVKRVTVIRPAGNAVEFDFAWDEDTQQFSQFGYAVGERDGNATYVLRDVTPASSGDLGYELQFTSGIIHVFNGGLTGIRAADGRHSGGMSPMPDEDGAIASDHYEATLKWSGGRIDSVEYRFTPTSRAGDQDEQTIAATLGYEGEDITSLTKRLAGSSTNIDELSYAIEGKSVTVNGIQTARTGSVAGGSVTLTTTNPDVTGSTAATITFNNRRLTTQVTQTLVASGATTANTTYEYAEPSSTDRYAGSGLGKWTQVKTTRYADGSWESFEYDPTTGWLAKYITPFQNSASGDDESAQRVQQFTYEPTDVGGGDAINPYLFSERARKITSKTTDVATGITLNQFSGDTTLTRTAADAAATWGAATYQTQSVRHAYGASDAASPLGGVTYSTMKTGHTLAVTATVSGAGLQKSALTEITQTIDSFGNIVASTTKDLLSGLTIGTTSAETDGFGRVIKQTGMAG
ncbi:MAG TPA: hypothetical protein VK968_19290, partial [Roseimicrobium sp.]|nr:hypothetical protein [Roseimicrobium sp.]